MLGCSLACYEGEVVTRVPYRVGDERTGDVKRPDQCCHDCNAADGHMHHPGCDMERCPICGRQLISCGCRA